VTLAAIRALFEPGQVVTVTNHYITRPDHPCYGTQTRTIARVTSTGLWFTESGRVAWPKREQIVAEGSIVRLFGGGAGQQPADLFLTIETTPIETTPVDPFNRL
jgi:hypothetical protein